MSNIAVLNPIEAKNRYQVNDPQRTGAIRQPLYDYQAYALGGQTSLSFFQTPVGQNGKTFADTNMSLAGQLPSPQSFMMTSVSIDFFPGVDPTPGVAAAVSQFVNDVWAVGKGGYLEIEIMDRNQLRAGPLKTFPPTQRMVVDAALADTTTADAARLSCINYASWAGPTFNIPPMFISSSQNFKVTLNWPTAVALPSGVAGRIGIVLDGVLYRAVVQ